MDDDAGSTRGQDQDGQVPTVYLLGAGLNRVLQDQEGYRPPLLTNFFQVAWDKDWWHDKGPEVRGVKYKAKYERVYEYIHRYWKKDVDALGSEPFDLEECFTLLQLQEEDADAAGDAAIATKLRHARTQLSTFLTEILSEFEFAARTSSAFRELAQLILKERPTVLTFNYDLYLEKALELVSGMTGLVRPEDASLEPTDSWHHWKRALAYGIEFDHVAIQYGGLREFFDRLTYYSAPGNEPYDWSILKLHGSLNWFRYLPENILPVPWAPKTLPPEKLDQAVLIDESFLGSFGPQHDGWLLDPIIVTPVLYKDRALRQPVFDRLLSPMWHKAHDALHACKRLVIIGYSFSATDFHTRRLFLESFASNDLNELVVVNPDTSVVAKIKDLCHFDGPVVVCRGLDEYLAWATPPSPFDPPRGRCWNEAPWDKVLFDPRGLGTEGPSINLNFSMGMGTSAFPVSATFRIPDVGEIIAVPLDLYEMRAGWFRVIEVRSPDDANGRTIVLRIEPSLPD